MNTFLKSTIRTAAVAAGLIMTGAAAFAAGDGTGIQAGFTEAGTDLNTLLTGAGGFIIVIVGIGFAVAMLAMGKGWGPVFSALGLAMVLGYGVNALQGISGVSATTDILLAAEAPPSHVLIIEHTPI